MHGGTLNSRQSRVKFTFEARNAQHTSALEISLPNSPVWRFDLRAMSDQSPQPEFKVWAADDVVYGPVPLATLVQWIQDERVLGTTWIYSVAGNRWNKAVELPELADAFAGRTGPKLDTATGDTTLLVSGLRPGMLRRVKALATMNDQQLGRFVQLMEIARVEQYKIVVRQGAPGDAMYAVLDSRRPWSSKLHQRPVHSWLS